MARVMERARAQAASLATPKRPAPKGCLVRLAGSAHLSAREERRGAVQRPQGSGGGPGLGLKITRAVGGVRRRLGRSAGRGGAPERPCKHADVGIDGVPICAAVCTTDAALYKWLAAEYCRVWRTIALQRIDLSGCCVREVISSGTRMALKILVSAVRFRPRPPN